MSADFAARFPILFHAAPAAALPSIRRHGLLSAEALCRLFDLPEAERNLLLRRNRRTWVELRHAEFGRAWLRRQLMPDRALAARLVPGLTPEAWRGFINRHVFLWRARRDADRLAAADPDMPQVVLRLATAVLIGEGLSLAAAPVNGGAIDRRPAGRGPHRGPDLYVPIALLPPRAPMREVVVPDTIPPAILARALLP
ncbi:DUF7002 family protein [Elioraea thermophila]|uniref:DUF7002 family protein n=1 Tax=Elioraea thermophila TaxID=2185104 RepID=UPI000DF38F83|nr:hypothetical protein [Elioraea thermophila]